MIIIDTNVLSELMRRAPSTQVISWFDSQPATSLWITAITAFECRLGLELLPAGKRRTALEAAFTQLVEADLGRRVLPFDEPAAAQASVLAARRQRAGQPVDLRDTMIAGIAQVRRATVATRNVDHFRGLSVAVVDPWAAAARSPGGH